METKQFGREQIQGDNRVQLLTLCIDLLNSLHSDAESEFSSFSEEVVSAAKNVGAVDSACDSTTAELCSTKASESISNLIMRMQFSDRFCQRVENVSQSLELLKQAIAANREVWTDDCSPSLLDETRGVFTTEQEREMFDGLFAEENTDNQAESKSQDLDDIFF